MEQHAMHHSFLEGLRAGAQEQQHTVKSPALRESVRWRCIPCTDPLGHSISFLWGQDQHSLSSAQAALSKLDQANTEGSSSFEMKLILLWGGGGGGEPAYEFLKNAD